MEVIHELTAQYDSRKSFYGKAMTDGSNLWSYKTLVASWDDDGGTEIEHWSVQKARM